MAAGCFQGSFRHLVHAADVDDIGDSERSPCSTTISPGYAHAGGERPPRPQLPDRRDLQLPGPEGCPPGSSGASPARTSGTSPPSSSRSTAPTWAVAPQDLAQSDAFWVTAAAATMRGLTYPLSRYKMRWIERRPGREPRGRPLTRARAIIDNPGVRGLLSTAALFAIAAGVNTGSVALQQRGQHLTRHFGQAAWPAHLALITPPWALFLLSLSKLDRRARWPLPERMRFLGVPVLAAAVLLWTAAFKKLGPARMANGSFFGAADSERVSEGVFRWLENPVYDGYALALVGQALLRADARYLVLAAESVLLLNGLEARVENGPFRRGRSMPLL